MLMFQCVHIYCMCACMLPQLSVAINACISSAVGCCSCIHPLGCMTSCGMESGMYMHAPAVSALQMNPSRAVFSLVGHAEILQDTACKVRSATV